MMKILGFDLTDLDWMGRGYALASTAAGMRPISCWASQYAPADYEALLKSNGVQCAPGAVMDNGDFVLMVHEDDVEWARGLLERAGAWLA